MKGIASILQNVPRSILAFAAMHAAFGVLLLVSLALSHCVDPPIPEGMYRFDCCSLVSTPWNRGTVPFYLSIAIATIAASISLLRAHRPARWVLTLAITTFLVYSTYEMLLLASEILKLDLPVGAQLGWSSAWTELLGYSSILWWILLFSWIAFDVWFLFRRSENFFRRVV